MEAASTAAAITIRFMFHSTTGSADHANAPRHQRGAKQDQHDRDHLQVNDQTNPSHILRWLTDGAWS